MDETDLPVTPKYVQQILANGVTLCSTSKWNNTVLVRTTDTTRMDVIARLPFVKSVRKVSTNTKPDNRDTSDRFALVKHNVQQERTDDADPYYGDAFRQINQLHGQALHAKGFKGKGMTIAIIDGGFYNADIIPMLKNVNILGVKDFVDPTCNVYEEESHGMMVLSCIGTNQPGIFVGTAPEASFWLIRSEDGYTEQMVEEDNWCAAVEFADSVGADVLNTSLGYSKYDNPADNVRYWEMDGHQRICSHTGSLIASKGMVLCTSAGNESSKPWKLISIPADADDVLTVGAVDRTGLNANFSSLGNTADGRIKPDVMAMGVNATVLSTHGRVTMANGTSFASPIMCGMVACFWQAHPNMTALEVVKAVRALGDNVEHPNNVFGYGIPDFSK
jgi:subtilisin family serine protease